MLIHLTSVLMVILSRGTINTLKILGVTLDDKFNFKAHIRNICQTASCHINALKRISKFMNEHCRLSVYKSFINANFNYCPIVWMFCGKTNLNKLEKLQERVLAPVYGDNSLNYDDMLQRSGQLRIRINLMRLVAIEMFKCSKGVNPLYLNDMFINKESNYNLLISYFATVSKSRFTNCPKMTAVSQDSLICGISC